MFTCVLRRHKWRCFDAAWRKQALGEKVEELCDKSVRENVEQSNTGICRLCVNQLISSHAFVYHLKNNCARNSKRLSRTQVDLEDGSTKVAKKQNKNKKRKMLFSPPRPNIHTHCDTISSNSCSFESLDSDSESSPLSASVPQHLPSCVLMQTLQTAAPVIHSTPRATGKENVTPISLQSRLSSLLPLAPDKLETDQVEMIFVCFGSARSERRVPSRVHVESANRPWHEEQTSRRASGTLHWTGQPHSEHRFPAPSSKEGCRKPVLGVCWPASVHRPAYGHPAQWSMMKWCLMSSDVGWHIRDKLWPMPKHDSIILYVHGNQKAR